MEDIERPKPMTRADSLLCPKPKYAAEPIPRVVSSTWASPNPKMVLRITHSREGCSSRPMTNIRSTMPNSAICWVASILLMRPRPKGPIMIPAAR